MTACNKQPSPVVNRGAAQNGAPTQTPPIAALPLATAAAPAAAPAPPANALAAPTQRVSFSPAPQSERYRYLDDADSMGGAFSDTPPDYAVDYQGTRPWIWRARNGAYRIVERLPRGERYYYYRAGQDQPFLVRDPDYSYAYNGARLVGVYGPGGAPLDPRMAAERSDYASRYFDRSRELYRAAQDQRRQAAYASEWAQRRDDLRNERQAWQEQQMRDREWRAWHDAHQSQEAQEWGQERDQRLAYAQAIGIPPGSSGPPPNPDEIARRQAAYFAARNARQQQTPIPAGGPSKAAPSTVAENHQRVAPPIVKSPAISQAQHGQSASPAPQPKTTDLAQLQQAAAAAKQKEATAAQAKAAEAAQAQKAAADQKNSEAAKAQASAAQAAQARKAAEEAKQKEAAAAKAKSANTAEAQKAAAEAKQKEAAASQAKAVQAAQAEKAAADAKQKQEAAAQAHATQAAHARQAAEEARHTESAAAQAKAARAAAAQKADAEAKQHEAAAVQAKAHQAVKPPGTPQASKGLPAAGKEAPNGSKAQHEVRKDQQQGNEQQ